MIIEESRLNYCLYVPCSLSIIEYIDQEKYLFAFRIDMPGCSIS